MKNLSEFDPLSIVTVSGAEFNLINPDFSVITIEDIAHGLAYTCRWNGHTKTYYSVAEHSLKVCDRFSHLSRTRGIYTRKGALGALLHDAEEAYWGDIITPIKRLYPDLEEKMTYLRLKIMEIFHADYISNLEFIEKADKSILEWEYDNIVRQSTASTQHPFLVKQRFLAAFDSLAV